jgi:hypothetical protein
MAGTPTDGGRRRAADGRTPRRAADRWIATPAGAMLQYSYRGGIHAYAVGEGGYGGSPIGEAGEMYQQHEINTYIIHTGPL